MNFNLDKFHFERTNVVFLRHIIHHELVINDNGVLDVIDDCKEKKAQWNAIIRDDKKSMQLQNVKSEKYLIMNKDGSVTCDGNSNDALTIFKYNIIQQSHRAQLESNAFDGKFIIIEKINNDNGNNNNNNNSKNNKNNKNNEKDEKDNDMKNDSDSSVIVKGGPQGAKVKKSYFSFICVNNDDYMEAEKGLTKDEKCVRRWLEIYKQEKYVDELIKAGLNTIDKLYGIEQSTLEKFGIDSNVAKRMTKITKLLDDLRKESPNDMK